jgi:hypothetical protein
VWGGIVRVHRGMCVRLVGEEEEWVGR